MKNIEKYTIKPRRQQEIALWSRHLKVRRVFESHIVRKYSTSFDTLSPFS
jgi:hypothetical protein